MKVINLNEDRQCIEQCPVARYCANYHLQTTESVFAPEIGIDVDTKEVLCKGTVNTKLKARLNLYVYL